MACFLRKVAAVPYCRSMFRRRSLICLSVSMIGSAIRCGSAKLLANPRVPPFVVFVVLLGQVYAVVNEDDVPCCHEKWRFGRLPTWTVV